MLLSRAQAMGAELAEYRKRFVDLKIEKEALERLICEWALYQIYPGKDELPTTEHFVKWYRKGSELNTQLLRLGGIEPPYVPVSDDA